MIIPIEWLKEYVDIKKSPKEIGESFTALGLMLDRLVENGILDLEHRMDRSDWLSIVGCARDLAAIEGLPLRLPEGAVPEKTGESKGSGGVEIKVEAPDLVRRFNTRVFRGVKVKESPKWLRERLKSYGLPSKNNIVDITNYVMVELGQPMHAQDLAKFSKQEIVLRRAKTGEEITTLLGERIKLDSETLVLAEGKNLIGIGAIVGSPATAVDESTTDIILDAGNYNQSNIRKTSRRLNIRNETVLRTEKFLHPHLTQMAIERATKLILELAGGQYFENIDYYPKEVPLTKMPLRYSRIEKVGGILLPAQTVKNILKALGYRVLEENSAGMQIEVPYFRTDIAVEDDIVSDILRINNYENIPLEIISAAPPKEVTPEIYNFEEKCRDILVSLGMHEHITNPLVKFDGNNTAAGQIRLENSLNSEQDALRTSIHETLKPVLAIYQKHKINSAKLFEVGLTYYKIGDRYENIKEIRTIEGVVSTENGVKQASNTAKEILAAFFKNLGIDNVRYEKPEGIEINGAVIFQNKLALGDIRLDSFTLFSESSLKAEKSQLRVRDTIMHKTTEDITLEVDTDRALGPTLAKLKGLNEKITDVFVVDEFVKGNKKAVTIRLVLESANETNREEVEKIKSSIKL